MNCGAKLEIIVIYSMIKGYIWNFILKQVNNLDNIHLLLAKYHYICRRLFFKLIIMDKIDAIDLNILRALQENAKLTTRELAEKVNLSSTPVFERLKRLEKSGYIKKYTAIINAEKLKMGFMVFCNVKLKNMNRQIAEEFESTIQGIPEVTECYNTSGNFDFLLKIHVADMQQYREFLFNKLGKINSLGTLESVFVMKEIKHNYSVNV